MIHLSLSPHLLTEWCMGNHLGVAKLARRPFLQGSHARLLKRNMLIQAVDHNIIRIKRLKLHENKRFK